MDAGASVFVNVKFTAMGFSMRCKNTRWTPVANRDVISQHRDCHHRDMRSWDAQFMGSSPDTKIAKTRHTRRELNITEQKEGGASDVGWAAADL